MDIHGVKLALRGVHRGVQMCEAGQTGQRLEISELFLGLVYCILLHSGFRHLCTPCRYLATIAGTPV